MINRGFQLTIVGNYENLIVLISTVNFAKVIGIGSSTPSLTFFKSIRRE
jgi:hypothetical protein